MPIVGAEPCQALGSTSRLQVVDPTSLRPGPTTQGRSTPKKVGPGTRLRQRTAQTSRSSSRLLHFGPIGNLEQLASLRDLRTFDGARTAESLNRVHACFARFSFLRSLSRPATSAARSGIGKTGTSTRPTRLWLSPSGSTTVPDDPLQPFDPYMDSYHLEHWLLNCKAAPTPHHTHTTSPLGYRERLIVHQPLSRVPRATLTFLSLFRCVDVPLEAGHDDSNFDEAFFFQPAIEFLHRYQLLKLGPVQSIDGSIAWRL
jgi:hypothetical protein